MAENLIVFPLCGSLAVRNFLAGRRKNIGNVKPLYFPACFNPQELTPFGYTKPLANNPAIKTFVNSCQSYLGLAKMYDESVASRRSEDSHTQRMRRTAVYGLL